jgi:HAD superfamily hydrolase (TIGR01509 family)
MESPVVHPARYCGMTPRNRALFFERGGIDRRLACNPKDTKGGPVAEISLILFDLNGVLYHYDRDARIGHLSSVSKRYPAAVKASIWDSGFEDLGDTGAFDAADYLRGFGARLGCDLSEADWVAAQRASVTPIADTLALLPRIRPAVRRAVLTNNNLLVLRHFATLYPEVADLAGALAFVSAQFGARKPEEAVYRRCLGQLGVAPAAALFVDDSEANVAGARAAGLQGCHYVTAAALAADLRRLGVLRRGAGERDD